MTKVQKALIESLIDGKRLYSTGYGKIVAYGNAGSVRYFKTGSEKAMASLESRGAVKSIFSQITSQTQFVLSGKIQ